MPDVVITADYSVLPKAEAAAKNLEETLKRISGQRLDLTAQIRDSVSETERLAIELRRVNDEIARMKNEGAKRSDLTGLYEQQANWRSQVTEQKNHTRELQAQDRILANHADKIGQQLDDQKELIKAEKQKQKEIEATQKAQEKAERDAARAKEKADREAAQAERRQIEETKRAKEEAYRYEQQLRENAQKSAEKEDEYRRQQEQEEAREQARLQQEAIARYQNTMRGISTVLGGAGALSNLTGSFASGIGGAFSGMAGLFGNTNVSTALTRFLTYNALRGITNNLSGIVSRYDIMSTFIPYMEVAGVDQAGAEAALARVNQAILGLPIGLDESAQRLRRYQMFLGNVEDATNLTIGAQNAILAGGASDQMKNMAYMQIDRLLAAGKLNTARQWLSLIQGLGVSMRFISEQMGTAGMDVRDLAAGLASGAIDAKEFLNALMELGKGESDAAQGLETTLDIYKGTIEAWINNIQFASTRGGENIMKALNQTLVDSTGQGITGYMKNYRDFLNDVFGKADEGGGISGWIKDNPDAIIGVMREGYTVIEALSQFNASDIGLGIAGNTERLFDAIATGLNSIPDGKLEEFVSFATTLAGPAGAGMSQASNLGLMLGVFERFNNFDFSMLTSDMSDAVGDMAGIVNWLLNVGKLGDDEFMSKLLSYGAVFGKPVGSALTTGANLFSSLAMMKIAFPSLFSHVRTTGGGMNFLYSSFANAPNASPFLGALAPALLGIGTGIAAGAGAAGFLNSREASAAAQIMSGSGLIYGYDPLSASKGLIAAANKTYNQWINSPEALGKSAQDNIRASIVSLEEEYDAEQAYLVALREMRKEYSDEVANNADLTAAERREYAASIREIDRQIPEVEESMAGLNAKIIEQGTGLNGLVIKYGDYEVEIKASSEETKKAAEETSELANRQRELANAYAQTRQAAFQSIQEQLGGLGLVERATPDKGYSSFLSQDLDYVRKSNKMGDALLKNADYINQFLAETEDYEFGLGITDYLDRVLGTEDIEQIVPRFEEVAELLKSGNFEKLRDLISELNTSNEFSGENGLLASLNNDMDETVTHLQEKETETAESFARITEALNGSTAAAEESFTSFKDNLMETTGVTEEELGNMAGTMESGMGEVTSAARTGVDNTANEMARLPGAISDQAGAAEAAAASVSSGVAAGLASNLDLIAGIVSRINEMVAQVSTGVINAASATGAAPVQNQSGPIAVTQATGGPIFKAFGSDTVPAMLTPGEYIIRKGAADFFGRGLLERINALDIGGAFDRLILNSPVTAGRYGGNVYNKDSHASVNQTFINSSPDYGRRRAMRFAHAL